MTDVAQPSPPKHLAWSLLVLHTLAHCKSFLLLLKFTIVHLQLLIY